MKQLTDISLAKDALLAGGLIVAKTDTIYGILARAVDPDAVSKLYLAKNRNPQKSCIILVSDIDHIPGLSASHKDYYLDLLRERPTTIVLLVADDFLPHLKRQNKTLAIRLVKNSPLAELINSTGPLIAPIANTEGQEPPTNIGQAIDYFGDLVDIYVDGGTIINNIPSKIIAINDDDEIEVIRD